MLAAVVFQSPFVFVLLLLICGILLGYALGTGQRPESDGVASIAVRTQALPSQDHSVDRHGSPPLAEEPHRDPVVVGWSQTDSMALRDALAVAEHERSTLAAALQVAHDDVADLQEDLASHQRAVATIERYRQDAQEELLREKERVSVLQARCREQETMLSRFDAVQDELNELRARNAYLQAQLTAAQEGHRQAQLEWKSSSGEVAHYQDQIRLLEQQRRSIELEVDKVRADRESLLASLRGAQEQNRQLSQQLGDQELHAEQLREELASLRVLQSYWESREVARPSYPIHEQQQSVPLDAGLERVRELEDLVAVLREQLTLVQLQAQELVQRQQQESVLADDSRRNLAATMELPATGHVERVAGPLQVEQDRRELVERIRQQNQQLIRQDEAA